ncbi:mast cell protease 8-like [Triplophysa dalaica]|uniref:mast cell protease 8-like n=1 Tax=Triplophysa dalaica TaxID=1582913 RepID=UPI0024DFFFE7|nr:mast cell protease 8-like [Triplophysa dalaica]
MTQFFSQISQILIFIMIIISFLYFNGHGNGAHDFSKREETVRINVSSYEKHLSYKQDPANSKQGDIMILKLEKKVKLNKNIKTITIPTKPEEIKVNTVCSIAGWGLLESNGTTSSKLMEAEVKIMNKTHCKKPFRDYIASSMLCVHGHGGSCKGDSGGPLVCGDTAVGVSSFSRIRDQADVYTEISAFLVWIQNVTKS